METNENFALKYLAKLDISYLDNANQFEFCQALFIQRQFHRLILFFESLDDKEKSPIHMQYWYLQSLCKIYKYKKCQVYIENLPTALQNDPKIIYTKGICLLKRLNFQSAIECFTKSFLLNPYFISPLNKLLSYNLVTEDTFNSLISNIEAPKCYLEKLYNYASLSWYYNKNEKNAFRNISKLYKKNMNDKRIVIAYISCCFQYNKKAELYVIAQRLFDSERDSLIALLAVGCHMRLIYKSEIARTLLMKAIRMAPSFAPAWISYAITYWMDGDPKTSLSIILIAIRAFPKMELLHIWAGKLSAECGDFEMAIAYYDRCKKTSFVLNEIGCILLKLGKYNESVEILEKAIKFPDACSTYFINCATANRRNRNYFRALELLDDIETKEPENPNVLLNKGFTYHLIKRYDEAFEYYTKVLKLSPDNRFANNMLDEVVEKLVVPFSDDCSYDSKYNISNDIDDEEASKSFNEMFTKWKESS